MSQTPNATASARVGAPLDLQLLGDRLGAPVSASADGVARASLPRADLQVKLGGTPAPRALDLGTHVEFRSAPGGVSLAGEVALLQDEVDPVLDTLLAHGIDVIGLHNRFAFDEPRVLSLHFAGTGNPALLASGVQSIGSAVRDARLRSKIPASRWPGEVASPAQLDATAIGGALGATATAREGEVAVNIPRAASVTASERGGDVLRAVWTGSDLKAAVDASFELEAHELAQVLGALRRGNFHLTALHASSSPEAAARYRAYFHGRGSSLDLVRGLRRALDARAAAAR